MKIAFHEIKNIDQINEKIIYHVFDLKSNSDRKFLHKMIDDQADIIGRSEEGMHGYEAYEEVQEEAQVFHEAVSERDLSKLSLMHFDFDIIEKTLDESLFELGYSVMKSDASSSIYVQMEGKEIRISDHKRPAYDSGSGVMEDHEYDMEIISEDRLIKAKDLENLGIYVDSDYFLE